MDVQKIETDQLVMFWHVSKDVDEALHLEIEKELKNRIGERPEFSKEAFYEASQLENKTIGVYFIPNSESYLAYGPSLQVRVRQTKEEERALLANLSNVPTMRSYGRVKANLIAVAEFELSADQKKDLETKGFNTRDIYMTEIMDEVL